MYWLNVFNNCFSNIIYKSTVAQENNDIIKSLMANNTCGYDEMTSNLIKIRSVNICPCLNHVCHISLLQGFFFSMLGILRSENITKEG